MNSTICFFFVIVFLLLCILLLLLVVDFVVVIVLNPPSPQRCRSPHLEAEVRGIQIVFKNCRGYRVKVSLIMIGGRGINNEERRGFCDSQKSRKGDITYFCERTERIFREDIKVSKLYIRKDFCPEPKKNSLFAHVQLFLLSN